MTTLRLSEAAHRGKALITQGMLGRGLAFEATYAVPAAAPLDGGVMAGAGAALLDLIQSLFGAPAVLDYADDARGGLEAEAEARLRAGEADGTISVSRLRSLPNRLVVTGDAGRLEIRLDGLERQTPSPQALAMAQDARLRRRPLPRPWDEVGEPDAGSALRDRPVLVIGASGFIGSRLVEHLVLEHGAKVTALVRDRRRAARIARLDIALQEDLDEALAGQAVVFNLAHDFRRGPAANRQAFHRLVDACAEARIGRFVHVSSIAVYDGWPGPDLDETAPADAPGSDYKSAKRAMEIELAARAAAGAFQTVILQPTIVYGPYSTLWTDLPAQWLSEGDLVLPEPAGLANAVYVDDVVQGLIRAAVVADAAGERFILSGPEPRPWRALFAGYAAALGRPEALKFMPAPAADAAAPAPPSGLLALLKDPMRLADWKPARLALNTVQNALGEAAIARLRAAVLALKRRGGPVTHYPSAADLELYMARGACSIERARTRLGYEPRFDLDAGLARTAAYLAWRASAEA